MSVKLFNFRPMSDRPYSRRSHFIRPHLTIVTEIRRKEHKSTSLIRRMCYKQRPVWYKVREPLFEKHLQTPLVECRAITWRRLDLHFESQHVKEGTDYGLERRGLVPGWLGTFTRSWHVHVPPSGCGDNRTVCTGPTVTSRALCLCLERARERPWVDTREAVPLGLSPAVKPVSMRRGTGSLPALPDLRLLCEESTRTRPVAWLRGNSSI